MEWKVRKEEDGVPLGQKAPDYGNEKEYFSLLFHYSGKFSDSGVDQIYVGGKVGHIDYCCYDKMSRLELVAMGKELGCEGEFNIYYNCDDEEQCNFLNCVRNDKEAGGLCDFAGQERCVGVFLDHELKPIEEIEFQETTEMPSDNQETPITHKPEISRVSKVKCNPVPETSKKDDIDLNVLRKEVEEMVHMSQVDSERPDSVVSEDSDSDKDDYFEDSEGNYDLDDTEYEKYIDSDEEWMGLKKVCKTKFIVSEEPKRLTFRDETKLPHQEPSYKGKNVFIPEIHLPTIRFELDQCFNSWGDFRYVVKTYNIGLRRDICIPFCNKSKMQVRCPVAGCPWLLYASCNESNNTISIKTIQDEHTCEFLQSVSAADTKWLETVWGDRIRSDPEWNVPSMYTELKRVHKLHFSNKQMYRLKNYAKSKVQGCYADQYALLYNYGGEIIRSNPGSTVKIKAKQHPNNECTFERMYICFAAFKKGLLKECRRVIFLDGCHLKTLYGGILLTVVGMDSNNGQYPIAWAVVEKENKDTWAWFISILVEDLEITNSYIWTVVSDKQKGLVDAVEMYMPDSEHRFCVYHLWQNFHKEFKGVALRGLMWRAARASRPILFNKVMTEIKSVNEEAFNWLSSRDPKHWSKAFFQVHMNNTDVILNNMSETFNALIRKARRFPILQMLEEIRMMLYKRVGVRKIEMMKWDGLLFPRIDKLVNINKIFSMRYKAEWNGAWEFEVSSHNGEVFNVDLEKRLCSCRRWQLTGIPCGHVISCFAQMKYKTKEFVEKCYTKESYLRLYSNCLHPMLGKDEWPLSMPDRPTLLPPIIEVQPGRPKKYKRQKHIFEEQLQQMQKSSRTGKDVTCGFCNKPGHNQRTCQEKFSKPASSKTKKKNPTTKSSIPDDLGEADDDFNWSTTEQIPEEFTPSQPPPSSQVEDLQESDIEGDQPSPKDFDDACPTQDILESYEETVAIPRQVSKGKKFKDKTSKKKNQNTSGRVVPKGVDTLPVRWSPKNKHKKSSTESQKYQGQRGTKTSVTKKADFPIRRSPRNTTDYVAPKAPQKRKTKTGQPAQPAKKQRTGFSEWFNCSEGTSSGLPPLPPRHVPAPPPPVQPPVRRSMRHSKGPGSS